MSTTGTDNTDIIEGTSSDDTIDAKGGHDTVLTGAGDDTVKGGAGRDKIHGGSGADDLRGEGGKDIIRGGSGDDEIHGGDESDTLFGDGGADTIHGDAGDDFIVGGMGDDTMTGGAGADTFVFTGNSGNDTITDFNVAEDKLDLTLLSEQFGYDDLTIADTDNGVTITHSALGGTITLTGVTAAELSADNFNFPDATPPDEVATQSGLILPRSDPWNGTDGSERMSDGEGSTTINARSGFDVVVAGEGDDTVDGGGGIGLLFGEEGDDTLIGGTGNDWLYGGEGDDTLTGGAGNDRLFGGEDADTFVIGPGHGNDTIADFENGADTIDLSAFAGITQFSDLTATQDGSNVVIDLSAHGGGTITLQGFTLNDLDASDFAF